MPQSTYVGVSGLTLTPKVYVACGISGQMQHMVGRNRSGAVFAINKDKNAPVFKQCDYGLRATSKTCCQPTAACRPSIEGGRSPARHGRRPPAPGIERESERREACLTQISTSLSSAAWSARARRPTWRPRQARACSWWSAATTPAPRAGTGGRSRIAEGGVPDFESEAPLERKITHERIAMLNSDSEMTIDFTSPVLAEEGKDSYSVLRGPFDQWLAEAAEDARSPVHLRYRRGGAFEGRVRKVVGIRAGEDEITSQVVIVAEGVTRFCPALGNARPAPHQMAVGIKEVFELPAGVIEISFLCPRRGRRDAVRRRLHHGKVGGGFCTPTGTPSRWGSWPPSPRRPAAENSTPVYQMLEDFKRAHPAVAPIIVEPRWSSTPRHMVPGGRKRHGAPVRVLTGRS